MPFPPLLAWMSENTAQISSSASSSARMPAELLPDESMPRKMASTSLAAESSWASTPRPPWLPSAVMLMKAALTSWSASAVTWRPSAALFVTRKPQTPAMTWLLVLARTARTPSRARLLFASTPPRPTIISPDTPARTRTPPSALPLACKAPIGVIGRFGVSTPISKPRNSSIPPASISCHSTSLEPTATRPPPLALPTPMSMPHPSRLPFAWLSATIAEAAGSGPQPDQPTTSIITPAAPFPLNWHWPWRGQSASGGSSRSSSFTTSTAVCRISDESTNTPAGPLYAVAPMSMPDPAMLLLAWTSTSTAKAASSDSTSIHTPLLRLPFAWMSISAATAGPGPPT